MTYQLRARLALIASDFSGAQGHLEEALSLQPEATGLFRSLAMTYREQGEIRLAREAAEKIGTASLRWDDPRLADLEDLKRTVQHYLDIGQEFIAGRKYSLAAEQFSKAVQLGPDHAQARIAHGRSMEILGDSTGALEQYQAALKIDSDNPIAHYYIATFYEREQSHDSALIHYQSAVVARPEHIPSQLFLAHALYRLGNYQLAREHYQEIVRLNKRHVLANYYLGMSAMALADCDTALAVFENLIKISSHSNQIKEAMARTIAFCSTDKDQLSLALTLSEQLMSTQPDAEAAQTMAMVHASNNQFDKAVEFQRLAIQRQAQLQEDNDIGHLEDQLNHYLSGERVLLGWPAASQRYNPPLLTPRFLQ